MSNTWHTVCSQVVRVWASATSCVVPYHISPRTNSKDSDSLSPAISQYYYHVSLNVFTSRHMDMLTTRRFTDTGAVVSHPWMSFEPFAVERIENYCLENCNNQVSGNKTYSSHASSSSCCVFWFTIGCTLQHRRICQTAANIRSSRSSTSTLCRHHDDAGTINLSVNSRWTCVYCVRSTAWNSLPDHLRDPAVDSEQFRGDLKTYWSRRTFDALAH